MAKFNISSRQASRKIKKDLEIKKIVHQDRSTTYLIPGMAYTELDHLVDVYFKKHKEMQFSQVTLQDIANTVGAPPTKIEEYAYAKACEYGLKIGEKAKFTDWEGWSRTE